MSKRNLQRALSWLLAALLTALIYLIVRPFLVSLVWASVLAIFFFPFYSWLNRQTGRPNAAALATVAIIALVLVIPVVLVTQAVVREAVSLLEWLRSGDVLSHFAAVARRHLGALPITLESLQTMIANFAKIAGTFLAQQSARLAGNVAEFVFDLAFMLLALFYLLRDGPSLVRLLEDLSPLGDPRQRHYTTQVAELVHVTLISSFIVAGVQGVLGGLIFWVLNIPSPALWAVLMAMMGLLPIAGPWLVWGPVALVLILTGEITRGIVLLVVGFLLVSGVDNVLRPILIAGRSQLDGLLVFISVLGGIQAFGLVGIVAGPVIVATATGILKNYRQSTDG